MLLECWAACTVGNGDIADTNLENRHGLHRHGPIARIDVAGRVYIMLPVVVRKDGPKRFYIPYPARCAVLTGCNLPSPPLKTISPGEDHGASSLLHRRRSALQGGVGAREPEAHRAGMARHLHGAHRAIESPQSPGKGSEAGRRFLYSQRLLAHACVHLPVCVGVPPSARAHPP